LLLLLGELISKICHLYKRTFWASRTGMKTKNLKASRFRLVTNANCWAKKTRNFRLLSRFSAPAHSKAQRINLGKS